MSLTERLLERIRRVGPIPFDQFVEAALYDEADGFFARGHGAGRAGADFVTSVEVGPLFGVLIAEALDRFWTELGRPDPFFVVEAGAGRGRLAADVLHAEPACAPALRYVLVERSAALRAAQRELLTIEPFEDAVGPVLPTLADEPVEFAPAAGPIVTALDELPAVGFTGVLLANELLDNLPFAIAEQRDDTWLEVRVGEADGAFREVVLPAPPEVARGATLVAAGAEVPDGARIPVPFGVHDWVRRAGLVVEHGMLVVVDYMATAEEIVERGAAGWLRTFRHHDRAASPLEDPGSRDITIDVPLEDLLRVASAAGFETVERHAQADWLHELGIDRLVDAARTGWDARAHVGDLAALAHRSRVGEGAALVDPAGLGAHRVLVFRR